MAVVNWSKASMFLQFGFLLNLCVLTVNAYTHTRGHPLFVGKRLNTGGNTEVSENSLFYHLSVMHCFKPHLNNRVYM